MPQANSQSKEKAKPTPTFEQRILEAGIKAVEKRTKERVETGLDNGVPPQELMTSLLQSVNQLAQTQVQPDKATFGNIKGIIPALIEKAKGGSFDPFSQRTQPLGFSGASQILNTAIQAQNAPLEKEKLEGDIAKQPIDMLKAILDMSQSTPEAKLALRRQEEEIKGTQQVLTESRKQFNEAIVGTTRGFDAISKVRNAATKLGDFGTGSFTQIAEKIGAAEKSLAKDPNYVKFNGVVNQTLNFFARDVFGEKGPLANPDIARTVEAIGADPTIPLQSKLELLDEVESSMALTFRTKKDIAEVSDKKFEKKFPQLAEQLKQAGKKSLTRASAERLGGVEVDPKTREVFDKDGKSLGRLA